ARLRNWWMRHDRRAGTDCVARRPVYRRGTQLRDGPQGAPGTDGCARRARNRPLRAGGRRRGGGTPQPGRGPGPEGGGGPSVPPPWGAARGLRSFRALTPRARVARQVDDALHLMRTEHPLSPQSRRFIATSVESAMKFEQELRDARWTYGSRPYYGDDWFVARWTW